MSDAIRVAVAKDLVRSWLEENEFEHRESHISMSASRNLPRTWIGFLNVRALPDMVYRVHFDRMTAKFTITAYRAV
jgi:hypothetical protein